jgi:hypothetical protein
MLKMTLTAYNRFEEKKTWNIGEDAVPSKETSTKASASVFLLNLTPIHMTWFSSAFKNSSSVIRRKFFRSQFPNLILKASRLKSVKRNQKIARNTLSLKA